MATYKITIRRTQDVRKLVGKQWAKLSQEEKCSEYERGKRYMADVMGYTPEVENIVSVTDDIYEQVVDDLDVASVIKAINKL